MNTQPPASRPDQPFAASLRARSAVWRQPTGPISRLAPAYGPGSAGAAGNRRISHHACAILDFQSPFVDGGRLFAASFGLRLVNFRQFGWNKRCFPGVKARGCEKVVVVPDFLSPPAVPCRKAKETVLSRCNRPIRDCPGKRRRNVLPKCVTRCPTAKLVHRCLKVVKNEHAAAA